MGWDKQTATDRVNENDFHDFEVKVADLSREMDFSNLGTKDVRRANGAHLYVDVPNMHLAVRDAGDDKQKQRKLIRAASVLRRIEAELLRSPDIVGDYEVGRIQQQAARVHALAFKPYDDEAKRAKMAVIAAITINSYIYEVFNLVFEDVRNFQSAAGIASGKCLIANIGFHGDRERISLGTSANLAAKVLGGGNSITVTSDVYDRLPMVLKDRFAKNSVVAGAQTYRAKGLSWKDETDLAEELGVTWKSETWKNKTEEARDALVLSEMDVAEARELIDTELLTEKNSRRTKALTIYADVDKFTSHVQAAEKDDEVKSLVRHLHMIRREFHAVLQTDYPGLALQHQGDRVFAILHMPCGEDGEAKRCKKAIHAAIGLQSSMDDVLKDKLGAHKNVRVAIGVAYGRVMVTRLGKKGKREVVCLGPSVETAENHQLASHGGEIRISGDVYEHLEGGVLKDQFKKDGDSYLATDLTFRKLDELEAQAAAKAGKLGAAVEGARVHVTPRVPQTRPWSSI